MLTQRQEIILKVIVDEFIKTAEPIGSKLLMNLLEVKYSSATLRNEMHVLEELGLLEKTHTSSGRIPSKEGYRYYVEYLMERELDEEIVKALRPIFHSRQLSNSEIIAESCRVLSEMTSLTTVALGSHAKTTRLAHLQMFPITDKSAIGVLIADDGSVMNKAFTFEESVDLSDIQNCCKVLDRQLKGTLVEELGSKLEELKPLLEQTSNVYEVVFQAMMATFIKLNTRSTVYTSGTANIMHHPEFNNVERMQKFIEMVENSNVWKELGRIEDSLHVRIGEASSHFKLDDLAIVSKSFLMNNASTGQLMVVGPTRMPYNKIISLLEYVSTEIEILYRKL